MRSIFSTIKHTKSEREICFDFKLHAIICKFILHKKNIFHPVLKTLPDFMSEAVNFFSIVIRLDLLKKTRPQKKTETGFVKRQS